jgi:hypothetical protein
MAETGRPLSELRKVLAQCSRSYPPGARGPREAAGRVACPASPGALKGLERDLGGGGPGPRPVFRDGAQAPAARRGADGRHRPRWTGAPHRRRPRRARRPVGPELACAAVRSGFGWGDGLLDFSCPGPVTLASGARLRRSPPGPADFGQRFDELTWQRRRRPSSTPSSTTCPRAATSTTTRAGANRPGMDLRRLHGPREEAAGETFYTRVDGSETPRTPMDPASRYRTLRKVSYDLLPGDLPGLEYVALGSPDASTRGASGGAHSLRLDGTGDGRVEFFSAHLAPPRPGPRTRACPSSTELVVENMKAFGAEHLALHGDAVRRQRGWWTMTAGEIPTDALAVAYVKEQARPALTRSRPASRSGSSEHDPPVHP